MDTYSASVASLLKLGRPKGHQGDGDFARYRLGPEHISELIRLMRDEEIARSEEPECYAQIHAWRALAELRASEAIEPLLEMLSSQGDLQDWNDWLTEEAPCVLGKIGP